MLLHKVVWLLLSADSGNSYYSWVSLALLEQCFFLGIQAACEKSSRLFSKIAKKKYKIYQPGRQHKSSKSSKVIRPALPQWQFEMHVGEIKIFTGRTVSLSKQSNRVCFEWCNAFFLFPGSNTSVFMRPLRLVFTDRGKSLHWIRHSYHFPSQSKPFTFLWCFFDFSRGVAGSCF